MPIKPFEQQAGNGYECPDKVELVAEQIRTFPTGATRNNVPDRLDYEGFLSHPVLKEFAKYMHKHRLQGDGKLRDSDNWQKGMEKDVYMKSMFRHFMDAWAGHRGFEVDQKEALCALLFNVQGYLHELLKE